MRITEILTLDLQKKLCADTGKILKFFVIYSRRAVWNHGGHLHGGTPGN